jgi:hypothetical protein
VKRKAPGTPVRPAPTLREIQESLQSAILCRDDAILDLLLDNSRTTRSTLFGVYRNAYTGRLVDVLRHDYPFLREYIGDDYFADLARAFIAAHPSRTQNARWFGGEFPAFLAAASCCANNPELSELAHIEKAVADAFDSVDAPVLGLADLARVPSELWGRMIFKPHPSAALLRNATNAFTIWKSLKDGNTPSQAARLADPESVIIWRQGLVPLVRVMPYEEAMMWTEASRGVRFDVLCELLAAFDAPEGAAARAAGYLQGWLTSELLTSAETQDRPASITDKTPRREPV